MKILNDWLKSKIKQFLLFLVKKLDEDIPITPKIRLSGNNIFKKEINLPAWLVTSVLFVAVFIMLYKQAACSNKEALGILLFLIAVFVFVIFYFRTEAKKINLDSNKLFIIFFIVISSLLFYQIYTSKLSAISFPLPLFTVLLALLVSVRVAITYAFVFSLIMMLGENFSVLNPMMHICGSLIAVINIRKIRSRAQFVRVGIKIFFAMLVPAVIYYLFDLRSLYETEETVAYIATNASLSVLMILAFLPIFESFFSRTTNIKLIELADFNNPLLKRLMLEAPGTYHHCLMTASLAEQAAEAIEENSLLARVCSYYHDIGKLKNPEYFIENQAGHENPHDELSPSMSGLVLVAHVKDGVAFAKKNKLDKVIIDAINQHHGTSLIQYFYFKAIEQDKDNVSEQDFRYPGEKPKTKVNAILMIADSVEAIARTLQDRSAGKLQEVVEKVINNKFTDGQFSDCSITLEDLSKISKSMTTVLCGMYHARIEYKTR